MDSRVDLKNLPPAGLMAYAESLGQPAFRGRQILAWIYRPDITDFDQMTNLAKEFRQLLTAHARISRFTDPIVQYSRDGAVKFGFRCEDGALIETVLIPDEDRQTLCVSSQVGCAMGCAFCLTGKQGFTRNLSAAEMVNQICGVRDWLLAQGREERLTNLVFMGMGEPLANLPNLLDALDILLEQRALDFSARRVTVSTCGLVPQMLELGRRTDVNLAISLHAPDDATRERLMPVNRRWPLTELLAACGEFPKKKRQRIMFEYTLLEGINDSDGQARQLAQLLHGIPCKINLLSVNEAPGIPFRSPGMERILAFQRILRAQRFPVFIRQSRGSDIAAACGQLAGQAHG